MRQLKYILAFTTGIVLLLVACQKKESPLTPSGIDEFGYFVPQGNNSYDQRIVNYYNRYGSYLLYNFTPRDAYWSVTKWDSTIRVIPADPAYVDKQLDLLDSTFFRYYADSTLHKYLPVKFLLCSSIRQGTVVTQLDGYNTTAPNSATAYVYQTFVANWGSDRILKIKNGTTVDSVARFRGNINYSFLRLMQLTNKMGRSELFDAASDYTTALVTGTNAVSGRYNRGFIGTTTLPNAATDWLWYVQAIVQNPYSSLTNGTGMTANNATLQGVLSPVKDSTGLIRKKYDAVIDYYKSNYNIDLQRIGNGAK